MVSGVDGKPQRREAAPVNMRGNHVRQPEGVLAAWMNELSETQRVSLGPGDRVQIHQCA
jgi:hypothetical protein